MPSARALLLSVNRPLHACPFFDSFKRAGLLAQQFLDPLGVGRHERHLVLEAAGPRARLVLEVVGAVGPGAHELSGAGKPGALAGTSVSLHLRHVAVVSVPVVPPTCRPWRASGTVLSSWARGTRVTCPRHCAVACGAGLAVSFLSARPPGCARPIRRPPPAAVTGRAAARAGAGTAGPRGREARAAPGAGTVRAGRRGGMARLPSVLAGVPPVPPQPPGAQPCWAPPVPPVPPVPPGAQPCWAPPVPPGPPGAPPCRAA